VRLVDLLAFNQKIKQKEYVMVRTGRAKMQVTLQLDPDFVGKIDRMAESLGMPRSQVMRNLMVNGYDDAVILQKAGLFSAYKLGEKVVRKIKDGLVSGKYSLDQDGNLKIDEKADHSAKGPGSEGSPRKMPDKIGRLL
jgi:hypothetical protein